MKRKYGLGLFIYSQLYLFPCFRKVLQKIHIRKLYDNVDGKKIEIEEDNSNQSCIIVTY